MDGGEGRSFPSTRHIPIASGSVPKGTWSLWFGFFFGGGGRGTQFQLPPPKRSHFLTALHGVTPLPGQRGTGPRGSDLPGSKERSGVPGVGSLAVAPCRWHVPGAASWHAVAAARAGADPWQLFHDGFPDPLFAEGDLRGSPRPQEPALGCFTAL